jgi:hypothetical protein
MKFDLRRLLPAPTSTAFLEQAVRLLRSDGKTNITVEAEDLSIHADGTWYSLGNAFATARQLWPWQRKAYLRHFLSLGSQTQDAEEVDWTRAESMLMPVVRDRFYSEAARLAMERHGTRKLLVEARLTDRHVVAPVLDFPSSTRPVDAELLAAWGKSIEEVLEVARRNLERVEKPPLQPIESSSVYHGSWNDYYEGSRILSDDTFRGLEIVGDPVVFVPARGVLLVAGSGDEAGIFASFRYLEAKSHELPYPISNLPIVRKWPRFELLELAPSHAAFDLWQEMRALELCRLYDEQKGLLDPLMEARGEDVFVAKLHGVKHPQTAEISTRTSWTKGVTALLPRADSIALVDPDRGENDALVGLFRWHVIERVVGPRLTPQPGYPERVRVEAEGFPTESECAEMSKLERTPD